MNELSCIIVIALGAARPGAPPNMAPAPAKAVIFSTSRRDAARTIFAIPISPTRSRDLLWKAVSRHWDVMGGKLVKSTASDCSHLAFSQEKFPADLHHRHP